MNIGHSHLAGQLGFSSMASVSILCVVVSIAVGLSFILRVAVGVHERPLVPALMVFGDSTSDVGNNNYLRTTDLANQPPYGINYPAHVPTGRWSDGFIVSDFVAEELGLKPPLPYLDPRTLIDANIIGGINFASGGAGLIESTSQKFCLAQPGIICNVASYKRQLHWYKSYAKRLKGFVGNKRGGEILSQSLYLITLGTNDLLNNYLNNPKLQQQYNLTSFLQLLIEKHVANLKEAYTIGARRMVIAGLPAIGCFPVSVFFNNETSGCVQKLNEIAIGFNAGLNQTLSLIGPTLPGAKISYIDIFSPIYNITSNFQEYGFKYSRACCGDGYTSVALGCNISSPLCENANEHVFWDGGHPTQRTNFLIASKAFLDGKISKYL